MAKEKKRLSKAKQRKPAKVWRNNDGGPDGPELLAWIEHARNHNLNARDTIVDHMRRVSEYPFLFSDVENGLRYYLRWCKNISPEFMKAKAVDCFTLGLSVFTLQEPEITRVPIVLTRLEDELLAKNLSPGRCLRSSSRLDEKSPTISSQGAAIKIENLPTLGRQTLSRSPLTRSQTRQLEESIESGSKDQFKPKKRKRIEPATAAETPSRAGSCNKRAIISNYSSPMTDDSQNESDVTEDDRESNRRERHGRAVSETPTALRRYNRSTLRSQLQLEMESAKSEISQLQQELETKKIEIREYEKQAKDLKKQVDHWMSIQRALDNDGGFEAVKARCKRVEDHASMIQGQLKELKRLNAFTKFHLNPDLSDYREWDECDSIEACFPILQSENGMVLRLHDSQRPFFIPNLAPGSELRSLIYRGLSLDPEASVQADILTLSKMSPKAIIRAITTSALRDWVFESDFPQFDSSPSELFTKYREALRDQDGPVALRNLNLAAHYPLLDSQSFKTDIVLKKANELAIKLSQILAPFFSKIGAGYIPHDALDFATWDHGREEYKERHTRFIKIFKTALLAKADTVLKPNEYSMVIYPPGTPFDKKTMTAETMEGAPLPEMENYSNRTVELCVDAAVFYFPKRTLDETATLSEAITQSKTFGSLCGREKEAQILVQAVVILRKEELTADEISEQNDSDTSLTLIDVDELE